MMFPNSSVRGSTFLRPVLSDQSSDGEKRIFWSSLQLRRRRGERTRATSREQKNTDKENFPVEIAPKIKKLKRTGMP